MCTPGATDEDLLRLDEALGAAKDDPRLVAVGEIGLDYFVAGLDAQRQELFYREQLAMAHRHGLPVIVHVRRSADALLKHLRRIPVRGIAHAFNGSAQQAAEFVRLGFRLGFGGTVTFDRALQIRRLAGELPLSAVVLETDAPDIPPHWLYRTATERAAGAPQGRNEPGELPRIGGVLAALRGMDAQELAAATTRNACEALPRLGALLPP
jgi:TatD DNase family protein